MVNSRTVMDRLTKWLLFDQSLIRLMVGPSWRQPPGSLHIHMHIDGNAWLCINLLFLNYTVAAENHNRACISMVMHFLVATGNNKPIKAPVTLMHYRKYCTREGLRGQIAECCIFGLENPPGCNISCSALAPVL